MNITLLTRERMKKLRYSRGVINDCLQCLEQICTRYCLKVHYDTCSFGLHATDVISLIRKQRNANHGDSMVDRLIDAVGSTMSYKGFGFWMTQDWVNFSKLLIINQNKMSVGQYKVLKETVYLDNRRVYTSDCIKMSLRNQRKRHISLLERQ